MGIQEGVPPSGTVREDDLVAVNKIALKDYALVRMVGLLHFVIREHEMRHFGWRTRHWLP
jgi:hypothetical protein